MPLIYKYHFLSIGYNALDVFKGTSKHYRYFSPFLKKTACWTGTVAQQMPCIHFAFDLVITDVTPPHEDIGKIALK